MPPFDVCAKGNCSRLKPNSLAATMLLATRPERDAPARRVEHYWLCDACSPFVTLSFDRSRGVITVPLPDGLGKKTVKMLSMGEAGMDAAEHERDPKNPH